MRAVFIAGTDTGVGKTIVTGSLAAYLQEKGYCVVTQKWIQTGAGQSVSPDIRAHFKMMDRDINDIKGNLKHVMPYTFKAACSPHLAARLEYRRIDKARIIKSFEALAASFDFVLVEGIGGVLVPFDKKRLVIDIVKELRLPVLLVAENRVGVINHALLTLEALKKRKIKILGVVFNDFKKQDRRISWKNAKVMEDSLSAQSGIFCQESARDCILAVAPRSLERNSENANRRGTREERVGQKIPCAKKLPLFLRKALEDNPVAVKALTGCEVWRFCKDIAPVAEKILKVLK